MAARTSPARTPATDAYLEMIREGSRHAPSATTPGTARPSRRSSSGLIDRGRLTPEEEDYLEVLGLVVAAYEDSIYEHPEFGRADRVRHLMEEHGLHQADLSRETLIPVQTLSDVLNGKRHVSPKVLRQALLPLRRPGLPSSPDP